MDRRVTKKGYIIDKEQYTVEQLDEIRKELTMMPQNFAATFGAVKKFMIFKESKTKMFLPVKYGIDKLGNVEPDNYKISSGKNISFNSRIVLRDYQKPAFAKTIEALRKQRGGVLSVGCAFGKCLGGEVNVMMYNGKIKNVKEIKVGDLLMGDDSQPRTVISLARGREQMYRVIPEEGMSYTCNESHILSLKYATDYKKGEVLDISVKDYLNLPKWYIESQTTPLRGYRVVVEFPEKHVDVDPYDLGYWLGNSNSNSNSNSSTVRTTTLQKHIPDDYKYNSRANRLKLLAGIIDSNCIDCYELMFNSEQLTDDVIYLCRSLGFAAYKRECKRECKFTVCGHFEEVVLTVGIKVEPIGIGDYYGFEISGNNRRFLLEDFTVTHNTVLSIHTMSVVKKKTIVIVDRLNIMNQWVGEIEAWTDAKVGIIQGKKMDVDGKDIVIAMIHTLSMKDLPPEIFADFGFAVYDEIHCMAAETFSQVFPKVCAKYNLGLSATVDRKDGLSRVFKYHIGDIFHAETANVKNKKTIINRIKYLIPDPDGLTEQINHPRTDKANTAAMITNMGENKVRLKVILYYIEQLAADPARQILVLSDRKQHLRDMQEHLSKNGVSCGLYIGNMSQSHLDLTCKKQVILGIYNLCQKAFNLKKLNTLVIATPRAEIQQIEGRILRQEHEINPVIIDFVDWWSYTFKNQWRVRKQYYMSRNYYIHEIEIKKIENKIGLKTKIFELLSLKELAYTSIMENSEKFGYNIIQQANRIRVW